MRAPGAFQPLRIATAALLAALALAVSAAAAKDPDPPIDLAGLLARIGERVEAYYARAESILCTETVRMQTMDRTLTPDPFTRILVYELRVSRYPATDGEPAPEPNIVRELKKVNGHAPKSDEDGNCLDLSDVALDPLSFLLPRHQAEYRFSYKGSRKMGARSAAMVDYAPQSTAPAEATWHDGCVSIDAPSRTSGRVWIDTMSGDVIRVDEQMRGPIDLEIPKPHRQAGGGMSVVFERTETSLKYKGVKFADPDETVMLPESLESVSIAGGSSYRSVRVTHSYAGYQRFVTGGRIIQD